MIEIILRTLGKMVLLILLQSLILNNIQITTLEITPYFYIIFILVLPFDTPGWMLLIIAFFLGFVIDIFSNSYGLHSGATVVLAFLRPLSLNINAGRGGYETATFPSIKYYGIWWFVKYAFGLVFLHHFVFFMMEAFSFNNFHIVLLKTFLTSVFTFFLIFLWELFAPKQESSIKQE